MIGHLYKRAFTPYLNGEVKTFSTVLWSGLIKAYGVDCLNWDGVTIQMQIHDDFEIELKRSIYDQIMGLQTALTTDRFYKDVEAFDNIVGALTGLGADVDDEPPTVLDVAWTVHEVRLNDSKNLFVGDIKRYIRQILNDEGMSLAPETLAFVNNVMPGQQNNVDATMVAGGWGEKQAKANEIDAEVIKLNKILITHLEPLGIKPLEKTAEWTSDHNRDIHIEKHWSEYGSPENYLLEESVMSSTPPDDTYDLTVRCKGPDMKDCSVASYSPSRGTVHVRRTADGRTVTLYKKD
jgi:hypothetical protein